MIRLSILIFILILFSASTSAGYFDCHGGNVGKTYMVDILPEWESIISGEAMQDATDLAAATYQMQYDIYEQLRSMPTDTIIQFPLLDNFLQANANSGFETLYQLNSLTSSGDYSAVNTMLANFTPSNTIEENYKQFYTYAMQMADSSLTDTAGVFALANLCPNTNGNIIYNAQALFMYLINSNYLFGNTCDSAYYDEDSSMMRMIKPKVKNDFNDKQNSILIYPNPTSERFFVSIPTINSGCSVIITNTLGQEQFNKKFNNTNIISIQQTLPKGLYFVTIKDNITNEAIIKKLTIE